MWRREIEAATTWASGIEMTVVGILEAMVTYGVRLAFSGVA